MQAGDLEFTLVNFTAQDEYLFQIVIAFLSVSQDLVDSL